MLIITITQKPKMMYVKSVDTRNMPESVKNSKDPADEPLSEQVEHHYVCDGCKNYLITGQDHVYFYRPTSEHYCEDCMSDTEQNDKEYGEDSWEHTEEL